jgi:AraC-like DNA-binding protein
MSRHFRVSGQWSTRLKETGIPVPALLREARLPVDLFEQPRVLLTTDEFFALWRGIASAAPRPLIGLELGTESRPQYFDPVAMAALATKSFGEAIRQVARHKQLSCPEEIVVKASRLEWSIQFRWLLATDPEPEVLTDVCFAWMLSIGRVGTGMKITPLRIEYDRPRSFRRQLERFFGCPVHCSAPRNAIVFKTADVMLPFVTRNADLLEMLAPQLEEELLERQREESLPDRVRIAIQPRLAGRRPKMSEIARDLHMSTRTLQRRLQEAGFTFQQVLEKSRHQLARHYLTHPELALNETAWLLGYDDVNSFVRAFRIWEGVPPAHWRDSQRAPAVS